MAKMHYISVEQGDFAIILDCGFMRNLFNAYLMILVCKASDST